MPLTPQAAEHLSRSTLHLAKIQAESACSGCGNGGGGGRGGGSQILRSDAAGAAWGVSRLPGWLTGGKPAAGIEPAIGGDWLNLLSRAPRGQITHYTLTPELTRARLPARRAWLGRTTQSWRLGAAATSQIMSICSSLPPTVKRRSALPRLSSVRVCVSSLVGSLTSYMGITNAPKIATMFCDSATPTHTSITASMCVYK